MSELRPTEILLSHQQIQKRVAELAQELRRDFPDDLHVIAVLKGAFVFLADLIRQIPGQVSLDFMPPMRQIDPKDHDYDGARTRRLPEGRK